MKKILSLVAITALFSTSMFAKCTDKEKGYSEGYSIDKEYKNKDQMHFSASARAYCMDSTYVALGKDSIKNTDAFFEGCLDGAVDFYSNKKQKAECK